MKYTFLNRSLILVVSGLFACANVVSQKGLVETDRSELAGIVFPGKVIKDSRILSSAAAKTLLEMEAGPYGITISEVEVFSIPNPSGIREEAQKSATAYLNEIERSGYRVFPSMNDPSFTWLSGNNRMILMYLSSTKKETALYLGKTDNLPPYEDQSGIVSGNKSFQEDGTARSLSEGTESDEIISRKPEAITSASSIPVNNEVAFLTGSWGMISGSPINYIDDNNYNVISGVSRGFGLELKADGTYLQISVVDSGRPSYRINVSTVGTWKVNGNLLVFEPTGRQYRRWEYEILKTDEHSVPEPYTMIWQLGKNEVNGKDCLYVKYEESQPRWDELCRE